MSQDGKTGVKSDRPSLLKAHMERNDELQRDRRNWGRPSGAGSAI